MNNTVIIIPYRNRQQHLDYFLNNTYRLIQKCMADCKIVIVEQANDKLFNRGFLLNVAFKEYLDKTKYFITHDVDINPTEDIINTYYTKNIPDNSVMGIYTSAANTLGGIIKLTPAVANQVNGFPNSFWGWGAEDKAFQNRCEFMNVNISKNILNNDPNRFTYFNIFNDVDDRIRANDIDERHNIEYNIFKTYSPEQKKSHILNSGLSSIEYKIVDIQYTLQNVEHIYVDF